MVSSIRGKKSFWKHEKEKLELVESMLQEHEEEGRGTWEEPLVGLNGARLYFCSHPST